jgi:hypothetical protein
MDGDTFTYSHRVFIPGLEGDMTIYNSQRFDPLRGGYRTVLKEYLKLCWDLMVRVVY